MKTLELRISVPDDWRELLIAELSDLDCEAFEEEDGYLRAYVPAARWSDVKREAIAEWLARRDLPTQFEEKEHAPENWNARWEETIQPVAVGQFLIKPTWRDVPPQYRDRVLLEIDPKMSFGTGYHESTRMMLRLLPQFVRPGDHVLDAGTGTGILAIAALKCGAASALAFDNDEWAQQNAVENFYLNDVADRAEFREGSLDTIPESDFDGILANIHRSVLQDFLPEFARKLNPGGYVLLAGLLKTDRPAMLATAQACGLSVVEEAEENEWWAAGLSASKE